MHIIPRHARHHAKKKKITTRFGFDLPPQSLVPELDLVRLQVGGLRVEAGRVEDEVGPALIVQRPRELVLGPQRVGVARQHKRQEVLLHLDRRGGVHRGGAAAAEPARRRRRVGARRGVGGGRLCGCRVRVGAEGVGRVPVVGLVGAVRRLANLHHGIPGLVVERVRKGHVVRRQVKVLLDVVEPQPGAGVVVLGVQRQNLGDFIIGDGREEDAQVRRHVGGGVDARVGPAIDLVLLVGDDGGAGEVEALLVKRGLVRVGDEAAVDARLQLERVLARDVAAGVLQRGEVDAAQAGQVAAVAAHHGRDIEVKLLAVLVARAGHKAGGHDVGLRVELLGAAGVAGHFEERLRAAGREAHGGDGVGVAAKGANVLVHPGQGVLDVQEAGVADAALVGEGGACGEAGEAETVVVRDKDEVCR